MAAITAASAGPSTLPESLPLELNASIHAILKPGSQPPAEPPPLEVQLAELFPDEDSLRLQSVQAAQARLREELEREEADSERLRRELELGQRERSMGDVQESIGALLAQLSLIREKARESETVVQETTRDIRSLDTAKKNVVHSMTVLKRLQMLSNGTSQLSRLVQQKNYREAANALAAVKALQAFFKEYMGIPRIAALWKEINELQTKLRAMAMEDYEKFFIHDAGGNVRGSSLPDAAMLIDAVGPEARNALVDWYTALQLREYRRIFRATDEAGQLDNVARRYAWFKRVLKVHEEEHAEGFLAEWNVGKALAVRFSEVTKDDLKSVLVREQARLQVAVLLEALQATMEFEGQISKKFNMQDLTVSTTTTTGSSSPAAPSISAVFDPYLGIYVDAQDKTLSDMVQGYRRTGATQSHSSVDDSAIAAASAEGEEQTVLLSSTELFYFYRQTLEQCARLSNRKPFRDLCSVFKKWLRIYANDVLRQGLVRSLGADGTRRSTDSRPNVHDIQRWCLIMNTSDYCASTSSQLEEKLRDKLHPDFREGFSLEPEREQFLGVISTGVTVLVRELEQAIEPGFNQMLRPPQGWAQDDVVLEKSDYVDDIASALEQVAVIIRQDVENKRYVRMWSDRAVGVVTSRFGLCIVKLKPISRNAARQLLRDVAEVKTMLLELPRYSAEEASSAIASSYSRYVGKAVTRIEMLLKVIEAPDNPATELVKIYTEQIGDRSMHNFQKVLELRGVRRIDQNSLIDRFVEATASQNELADSSFLTALDLEASSQPLSQAGNAGIADAIGVPSGGGSGRNSFHLSRQTSGSQDQYSYQPREPSGIRSPPPQLQGANSDGQGGAGRALADLRRFGTLFGAALGRRRGETEEGN